MERLQNWEKRLSEFFAAHSHVEFQYGVNDCALFASSAVEAITGVDPAWDFRGQYNSRIGSLRALKTIGNGDLESTFDARFEQCPAGFAQRGDLVFWNGSVGVCDGNNGVFVGEEEGRKGLVTISRAHWQKAWRV